MRVTDITGSIRKGMWNYEEPFPKVNIKPLGKVPWVDCEVYCEVFEGLHSQTGTYLETPAHYYGNDKSYLVADIPVEKLVSIPCIVLNLDQQLFSRPAVRKPVTAELLAENLGSRTIPENCAILVGTGWGKYWLDKCFLDLSPYFTYNAMQWLVSKRPYILGTDFPRWENLVKPEGFFGEFYAADILMLAPCINLEKIGGSMAKLTVLPLKIPGTSAVPCRAVIIEEGD